MHDLNDNLSQGRVSDDEFHYVKDIKDVYILTAFNLVEDINDVYLMTTFKMSKKSCMSTWWQPPSCPTARRSPCAACWKGMSHMTQMHVVIFEMCEVNDWECLSRCKRNIYYIQAVIKNRVAITYFRTLLWCELEN